MLALLVAKVPTESLTFSTFKIIHPQNKLYNSTKYSKKRYRFYRKINEFLLQLIVFDAIICVHICRISAEKLKCIEIASKQSGSRKSHTHTVLVSGDCCGFCYTIFIYIFRFAIFTQ